MIMYLKYHILKSTYLFLEIWNHSQKLLFIKNVLFCINYHKYEYEKKKNR